MSSCFSHTCYTTSVDTLWYKLCKNGIQYIEDKFADDCASPLNAFKAARLLSPSKANAMQLHVSAADIDFLESIPALNHASNIAGLKEELPAYVARADEMSSETDELHWWKKNQHLLPNWSSAAAKDVI